MVGVVRDGRLDADVREQLVVALRDLGPRAQQPVELLDLAEPERAREVVEALARALG